MALALRMLRLVGRRPLAAVVAGRTVTSAGFGRIWIPRPAGTAAGPDCHCLSRSKHANPI